MMSRVHKLAALLFLVIWVPLTAHCHLEKVPGLEFLKCASSDTPENSDCQGDGCQTVESGFYKISTNSRTAPVPVFCIPAYLVVPAAELQPVFGPLRLLGSAPPDLPQRWQFTSRASLPVRAPSIVS